MSIIMCQSVKLACADYNKTYLNVITFSRYIQSNSAIFFWGGGIRYSRSKNWIWQMNMVIPWWLNIIYSFPLTQFVTFKQLVPQKQPDFSFASQKCNCSRISLFSYGTARHPDHANGRNL